MEPTPITPVPPPMLALGLHVKNAAQDVVENAAEDVPQDVAQDLAFGGPGGARPPRHTAAAAVFAPLAVR